ncbi:Ltp family lipoprotein [Halobacillus sp. BAB-2008]|uniref:Ltp family lipoprotein n=1 Tax=Halobacillus sp. BAB-2008 TaxID=1246484 RepID=UPI0002A51ECF|nr:Ltp family lipoprotein [Halobacillus sp. BAB-2008]ELK47406.1 hypothetical protein D479_06748 [Halobacillus sp. BAB-2008]
MPKNGKKKPFYKKWWVWLLAILVIGSIATSGEEETAEPDTAEEAAAETAPAEEAAPEADTEEAAAEEPVEEEPEEPSVPREYSSALSKAESYAETMNMSKAAIYDQLVSEYGEQFPEEAAQYAIDNIEFDWKANALKKAESYADTMDMSTAAIYDQLVSEHGEQFTEEEAQYAVDNLE